MGTLDEIRRALGHRYRIDRELGRGGMGVVLAAEHLGLARPVALKLFEHRSVIQPREIARISEEARLAASVRHPHVVAVYEADSCDLGPYIAFELLAGETLRQRLERDRVIPLPEACTILLQIIEGLTAMHARGIVHRDIKPDNVMLTDRGAVVTDLGIARDLASALSLTATGMVVGSPQYMAPEQFRAGSETGTAADVHALGLLFFECLAGRMPFEGSLLTEVLQAKLHGPTMTLEGAGVAVPGRIERLVAECLERDPARRPTVAELRDRLVERPPLPDTVQRSREGRRASGRLILAAAAVTLGSVAFVLPARRRPTDMTRITQTLPTPASSPAAAPDLDAVRREALLDWLTRALGRAGARQRSLFDPRRLSSLDETSRLEFRRTLTELFDDFQHVRDRAADLEASTRDRELNPENQAVLAIFHGSHYTFHATLVGHKQLSITRSKPAGLGAALTEYYWHLPDKQGTEAQFLLKKYTLTAGDAVRLMVEQERPVESIVLFSERMFAAARTTELYRWQPEVAFRMRETRASLTRLLGGIPARTEAAQALRAYFLEIWSSAQEELTPQNLGPLRERLIGITSRLLAAAAIDAGRRDELVLWIQLATVR